MRPPKDFSRIVNKQRYSTATATLLAANDWWDGSNYERHGRNKFLYRTTNGAYFTVSLTQWQGERDTLTPINQSEAIEAFESELSEHYETYEVAFPDVKVVDA